MAKIYFVFLVILLKSFSALAETYHFDCVGVTTGKTIRDSHNRFDVEVDLSPPKLIGPIGPLSLCALTLNKSTKIEYSCTLSDTELQCKCKGGDYINDSIHTFSRLSGNLKFYSIKKNDVYEGNYKCTPIAKKLF
jgi:hypothetical protein